MTLSINDTQHNNALHYAECLYADCRVLVTVMLSVIMLNAVMLSVVAPARNASEANDMLQFYSHNTFIAQATVAVVVNYYCDEFIVQAT
jgi:hypothetical protein